MEDGGGRELAYVKMSRAKQRSTVYVVADSLDQAKEDLRREWETDRRLGWVIDTGGPVTDPLSAEMSPSVTRPVRDALRRGRLVAERDAILAVVPPDPSAHIRTDELQRSRLQRDRDGLAAGKGRYRDHPVADAIRELHHAEVNIARLERRPRQLPLSPGPAQDVAVRAGRLAVEPRHRRSCRGRPQRPRAHSRGRRGTRTRRATVRPVDAT